VRACDVQLGQVNIVQDKVRFDASKVH